MADKSPTSAVPERKLLPLRFATKVLKIIVALYQRIFGNRFLKQHDDVEAQKSSGGDGRKKPISTSSSAPLYVIAPSKALGSVAVSRLLKEQSILCDLHADFTMGLEAATRAIWNATNEICNPATLSQVIKEYTGREIEVVNANHKLASLIREVANEHGWLAGWKCFASTCPDSGMHKELIDNVDRQIHIYTKLQVSTEPRPHIDDIQLSVVATPELGNIHQIGPKTLGGHQWKKDAAYKAVAKEWFCPIDLIMGPCPFFGWIGVLKKTGDFTDEKIAKAYFTCQLMGIVDYDFDKDENNFSGGLKDAINRTAELGASGGPLRGAAWTGLLTMDDQDFNRSVQMGWVKEAKGAFLTGPADIAARDWAIAAYVDCAALAPFAYQSASELGLSRIGMLMAVVSANMHDFVYDMGSSSRISSTGYAATQNVFQYDIPQAWAIGRFDATATRVMKGGPNQSVLYGDNAYLATSVWSIFNVRYHAWERFIKYTRLLQESKSDVSAGILKRAAEGLVLIPENMETEDIGEAWMEALTPSNASKLVPREKTTQLYTLGDPAPILKLHGVKAPELCSRCSHSFTEAFFRKDDIIQAIPGLPKIIITSDSVALSAAIRRAALFATSPSSVCCDKCACIVGLWANDNSDRVVVAVMQNDAKVSTRDWLLENYLVSCVAFSPLRLISITAGFDLNVHIKYEPGVMGVRDIVDE